MTRIGFVAAFLLVGTVVASAALPPYWQRKAEIDAITDSADVARKLESHGPIDMIGHMGNDHYQVGSGGCTLDVFIVDDTSAAPMPGPRKFKLQLGELFCK
jgi:predicted urease superfamily metal-dependent hydrolase